MKRARSSSNTEDRNKKQEDFKAELKSACDEERYADVVRLGVEAMQEQKSAAPISTPLSSATETRASLYDQALSTITTTYLNSQVAAHHLQDAKDKQSNGLYKEENKALQLAVQATQQNDKSNLDIRDTFDELKTQWHLGFVYFLPSEILHSIFVYLGKGDLLHCSSVCKHWRDVIEESTLLDDAILYLDGTLDEVDRQWDHFKSMNRFDSFPRLSLRYREASFNEPDCHNDDMVYEMLNEPLQRRHKRDAMYRRKNHRFPEDFPFCNLVYFDYASQDAALDSMVFDLVTRCEELSVLKWDGSFDANNDISFETDFTVSDTPLGGCRLNHLSMSHCRRVKLGPDFAELVNDARSLSLKSSYSTGTADQQPDLLRIVLNAQESLEELTLEEVILGECGTYVETPNVYKNLKRLQLHGSEIMNEVDFRAPNLRELSIRRGIETDTPSLDEVLLRSCMANLDVLEYDGTREGAVEFLTDEMMHHLNQSRSLTLHSRRPSGSYYDLRSADKEKEVSIYKSFWDACSADQADMTSILPALHHLSLNLEPNTGHEGEIIGFIKARETANMHPLIIDVDNLSLSTEAKGWLKGKVVSLSSYGELL